MISPTDSQPSMRTSLKRRTRAVTYAAPVSVVEERMVERGLATSPGAAHQRLLHLRALLPQILECFVECRASERTTWFLAPADAVLERVPSESLTPDLLARALTVDGEEDGTLAQLMAHISDQHIARHALRMAHAEISIKRRMVRAICQQFGWTA